MKENPSALWMIFCGGIGGMSGWVGAFFIDNVKTRIQTDSFTNPKYKSLLTIHKKLGVKDVLKGFTPGFIRGFPVNAVTFLTFELTGKLLYGEPL